MAEVFVALISAAIVVGAVGLLVYAFARTARHTVEAGAAFFGGLGVLLALVGLVALVWTQLTFGDRHVPGAARWDVATGPLTVIALGLLVCIGAQILSALRDRDRSRGTRV
jgi:hypothetical protein